MSELTDDQLDGLFRKSAEEFDPPFDPAAWQDMKTRLDTADRPVPGGTPLWKNVLRWGGVVCLFLLLLVGSWYYSFRSGADGRGSLPTVQSLIASVENSAQPRKIPSPAQQRSAEAPLAKIDSAPTSSADFSAPTTEKNNELATLEKSVNETEVTNSRTEPVDSRSDAVVRKSVATRKTDDPARTEPAYATNTNSPTYGVTTKLERVRDVTTEPTRSMSSARTIKIGTTMGRQRTGKPVSDRLLNKRSTKTSRIRNITADLATSYPLVDVGKPAGKQSFRESQDVVSSAATRIAESTNQPNVVQAEAAGLPTINELAVRPARWPKALAFTGREVAVAPQPDTISKQVKPTPPTERGLSIRFAVAPDLSSVGLKNFARPGTNVGVLLEYRIAPRWSVQTGLIQSTKIYNAAASEYTAPVGTWNNGGTIVKPLSIDGQCNMFDIPINIRYDMLLRPRISGLSPSRWFVSGGVTSYYIKQEDYVYNYPLHTYNVKREESYSTGGYGFSQFNLSVGYERAITKRLSWQVEPFMKMPLKGVGFFKIDLLSTGTFFSIRYKL